MLRIRMTGDRESRGKPTNPGLPGKWLLKREVCAYMCVAKNNSGKHLNIWLSVHVNTSVTQLTTTWLYRNDIIITAV